MKKTFLAVAVACVLAAGCGGQADQTGQADRAASGTPAPGPVKTGRGIMQAVTVKAGPEIDGTLGSPIWAKCPPLALGECTTDKPGPDATVARVLFGPTHLYVAFDCARADTGAIRQAVTDRDGDVWKDDCVELFVTGDPRAGYFHFIINARGTLADARFTDPKRRDASWNSSARVRTSVEPGKRWIVTLALPLAELGAYVGANQTWVMNLNRTRPGPNPSRPEAEWSWAIMGSNDYHQVLDYGRVVGVTVPKRADGVTRTATPPPPPPSYETGQAVGGVTVYRRIGAVKIPKGADGTAWVTEILIRGSKGLKLAFLARGGDGITSVPLNIADRRANDNTTPNAYRIIGPRWRAVVYFVDRFRYNAQPNSTIGANTDFRNIRFHGNAGAKDGAVLLLRNVCLYRGEDTAPPAAPTKLTGYSAKGGTFLEWAAATDNVGVARYVIARAPGGPAGKVKAVKGNRFVKIGESAEPAYRDPRPPAGKSLYRVLAVDFQDNVGPWSAAIRVDNPLKLQPVAPPQEVQDRQAFAAPIRKIGAAGAGKVRKGVVLMFGDSLTYATNYRTAVEAALGRFRVEARGYPAQKTSFGRRKIDADLAAVNPEFCCILLGTNNGKNDNAIAAAMEDILAMVGSCRKRGTVPIVGTIPPRGFSDPASKPEARYNAALVKTCRANAIPICHLFEHFQSLPDRRKLLAGDGVHWSGDGFPAAGAAWAAAMEQVGFVLLDRP